MRATLHTRWEEASANVDSLATSGKIVVVEGRGSERLVRPITGAQLGPSCETKRPTWDYRIEIHKDSARIKNYEDTDAGMRFGALRLNWKKLTDASPVKHYVPRTSIPKAP